MLALVPILVLLSGPDPRETEVWQQVAKSRQWQFVAVKEPPPGDAGVKAVDALVTAARKQHGAGATYLIGSGVTAPMALYVASRAPHLFTAVLGISGSPKPAIETDRLFAANMSLIPIGWALSPEEKAALSPLFQRLVVGGYNITQLENPTVQQGLDFLTKAVHVERPRKIDCETGNPTLARCYWITPTQFDPSLRNDALRSTRIAPDTQAALDFGGFGYKLDAPGPGVLVEWLPPDYKGPLQLKDRLVGLSERNLIDAKHYVELMSQVTEEKPVAVTIDRNKERIRLVTRYRLRQREEITTARVSAEYNADLKEIVIVSRTVAALRLTVPPEWAPASINWNGTVAATAENPGCYELSLKTPGSTRPCVTGQ